MALTMTVRARIVLLATLGLVGLLVSAPDSSASTLDGAAKPADTTASIPGVVDPSSTAVTDDALPTAQIDGVVWAQAVAGDTVYAGGNFANARPAGSAPGVDTVPRTNLMAYSISTGVLSPSFAPYVNAQVKTVAVSPDRTRMYIGGDFTQVGNVNHYRIAQFDTATGRLLNTFTAKVNSAVDAIAATNSVVYVGGAFSLADGVSRSHLAAFSATDGSLLAWNPSANGNVVSMVLAPDSSRVIAGGSFTNVNGQSSAYGMASMDANSGGLLPWAVTSTVRDATSISAILNLSTDGTAIYGTGYVYSKGAVGPLAGNFEGTFSANPYTGVLNWIEDCHGDTYGVFATGTQVYTASHAHYCGNIGAYGETIPRSFHRAQAFTTYATGVETPDPFQYPSYTGLVTPSLVNWFPDLAPGTFTNQDQAAWSITGDSSYVVLGGEFPTVNGVAQQGLVRFETKPGAPSRMGPTATGNQFRPRATALSLTSVRLTWPANYDPDNTELNYALTLNGDSANPLWTGTVQSTFWNRPVHVITLTGLTPGATYAYRLIATDPSGNTVKGNTLTYTSPATQSQDMTYQARVIADGATSYYPMDEPAGTAPKDVNSFNDTVVVGSLASTSSGAIAGDAAKTLTSAGTLIAQKALATTAPFTYSAQIWFRTYSGSGGALIGWGQGHAPTTVAHDRQVYLRTDGRVAFTVTSATGYSSLVSPSSLNDGRWHQVTAEEALAGTALYIDGTQVAGSANRSAPTENFAGAWRIGAENLAGYPSAPSSAGLVGDVDEAAFYPTALSASAVQAQYNARGSAGAGLQPSFSASVSGSTVNLDASASTDSNGSIGYYGWNFGDGATASGVTTSHTYAQAGTYTVTLTAYDNQGNASTTRQVTIASTAADYTLFDPNAVPRTAEVAHSNPVTLGVTFSSSQSGRVKAIRFYKGSNNNAGPHTVTLWTSNGTNLGSATTSSETSSGWQTAYFATPIAINAGTSYIAAYYDARGFWAEDDGYFNNSLTRGPLSAPSSAGRYAFNNAFPNGQYQNANFWVDPIVTIG